MSDDKNKIAPQDASRINLNEPYEVKYWTNKFGISTDELRKVIEEVGDSVRAVKAYLGK